MSAFLCPNSHFDPVFSRTLIPSMKLCCHQNRSRRITKKKQDTIHFIIRLPEDHPEMWPIFEKKCQNVFFCRRNKEETYVQTFQQFLQKQNKKQKINGENELIACSKKKKIKQEEKFGAGQNFN